MKSTMIRSSLLLTGVVVAAGCAGDPLTPRPEEYYQGRQMTASAMFPAVVPLPTGFQPEGIALGQGADFYVGSTTLGAIYKGSLRTGEGAIVVPPAPGLRIIAGLSHDRRTDLLFAAGGPLGSGHVFDTATGTVAANYQFAVPCDLPCTFVNDVVVTRVAAYFTDSFLPLLYRVPLGPGGEPPDPADVSTVVLGGEFQMTPIPLPSAGAPINANGIDATSDGKYLIVVNFSLGTLYRVDPGTGYAVRIDLGGYAVPYGDGILLDDQDLYVVQNVLNQVAVIRLKQDYTAGTLTQIITSPYFRIPTTIADFGKALYAVNARFDVAPPLVPSPAVEFEVVRVSKP